MDFFEYFLCDKGPSDARKKKEREKSSAQLGTCFGRAPKPDNHVILRNNQPPDVLCSLFLVLESVEHTL